MKAKEYFDKYDTLIWEEAHNEAVRNDGPMAQMFIEFSSEMKDIIKQRHIKVDSAVPGVIREQNQKWNAVVNMFEKKYGVSPINRNGFKTAIEKELGVVV